MTVPGVLVLEDCRAQQEKEEEHGKKTRANAMVTMNRTADLARSREGWPGRSTEVAGITIHKIMKYRD